MKIKGFYNESKLLNRLILRVKDSNINEDNKQLLLDYVNHMEVNENIGTIRAVKNLRYCFLFSENITKKFQDLTRKDYENTLSQMKKEKNWSDNTLVDYKKILKAFSRYWNNGEYPEALNNVSSAYKQKRINPNDLLTSEEVKNLINRANTWRNKLMIMMLSENGLRIGELLTLQIKDIVMYENHFTAQIEGKTGKRTNYFIHSLSYLKQFFNREHSARTNNNAFLFYNTNGNVNQTLSTQRIRQLFLSLAKSCGIEKKVNPHAFRHYSATRDARNGWNESQLRAKYGWSQTSNTPSIYIHLSQTDVLDKQLEEAGLIEKSNAENRLKTCVCSCGYTNDFTKDYCFDCHKPISEKAKLLEKEKEKDNLLIEVIKKQVIKELSQSWSEEQLLTARKELE